MAPRGVLRSALEEAGEPRCEAGRAVLVDRLPVEPRGSRWAVESRLQRFQEADAGEELASINEGAIAPTVAGVHVGDKQLAHARFVEHRTGAPFIQDLHQVE